MIKYKYKALLISFGDDNRIANEFTQLGYDGYELVSIENGYAFFKKTINVPDRETTKGVPAPVPLPMLDTIPDNTPMRPVDDKLWVLCLLKKHNFNRREAAKEYGVGERTFYRLMSKYGLTGKICRSAIRKKNDQQ